MKKKKLALHWKIIIGLVLGVLFGLLSSSMGWNDFVIEHLGVDAVCAAGERLVPLEQAKILDLREDLL